MLLTLVSSCSLIFQESPEKLDAAPDDADAPVNLIEQGTVTLSQEQEQECSGLPALSIECPFLVQPGVEVILRANPGDGYAFLAWGLACGTGTSDKHTLTPSADTACQATFNPDPL